MKQFLKITKTKINIFLAFLALSFIWGRMTAVLYGAIIYKISLGNLYPHNENIFQIPFLVLLFVEFYLLACLAVYFVKKDKKITLSFSKVKQFLKTSKIKTVITFSLIIFSFIWQLIFSIIYGKILIRIGFENIENYMDYIFSIPFYILFILKFYILVCLAVYLVEKTKKQT